MKLFIKNMVSIRCKMLVKAELNNFGISYASIDLGEVEIKRELPAETIEKLRAALAKAGLQLMDDKKSILIERIKNAVIEMVHYADDLPKENFSDYLSRELNEDYHLMALVFSQTKGITIEQFIIQHKIEKVKELIIYDELNLTDIAWKMQYSSVAHLSSQFKKVTGLTPSFFKSLKQKRTKPNEDI